MLQLMEQKMFLKYSKAEAKIIFTSTHTVFEGIKEQILELDESFDPSPELAYSKGKITSENNIINSGKNFYNLEIRNCIRTFTL